MADVAAVTAGSTPQPGTRPAPAPTPAASAGNTGGTQAATTTQAPPSTAGSTTPAPGQASQPAAPPPSAPPPPQSQPVTVVAGETTLDVRALAIPATLAARAVSAEVLAQSRVLRLDTALGRVAVSTPLQSPAPEPGAQLRLLFDAGGAVRLQQVPAQPAPAPGQAAPSVAGGHAGQLAAGDIVKAQLLPRGGADFAAVGKDGAPVVVRIVAVTSGALAAGSAPAATTGALVTTGVAPGAGTIPVPTAPISSALPSGTATIVTAQAAGTQTVSLQDAGPRGAGTQGATLQILTGSVPSSAAGAPTAAVPLTATVTGHAPLGQPVLSGNGATLLLANGNLPDGATVRLEVLATQGSAPRTAPVIAGLTDALDEAMAVLASTQPALAAAIGTGRVPRFGPTLASGALFLLSALQGGSVQSMLGRDAQQALREAGQDRLLRRMGEALAQRAPRVEGDPATGDTWRSVYVPVAADQGWYPLRVAWREDGTQGEDEEDEAGSRFQIDFSFSRLGPTRLDGLVGRGRIDLLLVTRTALPPAARSEIEEVFITTVETMGLKGHLRFVEKPDLPPPEQQAAPEHAVVTA